MRGITGLAAILLAVVSSAQATEIRREVSYSVRNDTSRPMRDIIADMAPPESPAANNLPVIENIFLKPPGAQTIRPQGRGALLPGYQSYPSNAVTPPTLQSFIGLGVGNGAGGTPPDTNGDVSPTEYIQWINSSWAIFNKATGARTSGPTLGNSFWSGFGGSCQTSNSGDPLAIWDDTAQRWVMSQFITSAPFKQCVAVSTTSDPLGTYNRYEFVLPVFGDYPHMGVWTDDGGSQNAYLLVTHDFGGSPQTFQGASFMAFERDKMLAGQPAAMVRFSGFDAYGAEPIHLDGTLKARAGSCPTFIHFDSADSSYLFWDMCLNWATPGSSTISANPDRVQSGTPFRPNFGATPQLGSTVPLDSFGTHIMYRAAARTFAPNAPFTTSLVVNHTVLGQADQGGIKWVQFDLRPAAAAVELFADGFEDSTGGGGAPAPMTKSIVDEGTFVPDTSTRFMGAIAVDKNGNIGVGYTRSSATTNPTIMLSSRKLGDTPGELRDETNCAPLTTGSQTGSFGGRGRWGDYAAMSVDPADGCTFWHTNEYYPTTTTGTYQTRICSFVLDGCGDPNYALVVDSPKRVQQCAATNAADPTWDLRAGVLFGFNGNVVFSLTGTPGGASASFSTASGNAPLATTLTLTGGAAAPSGEYAMDVVGTSGAQTRLAHISFGLSAAVAAAPTLSSPANAAVGVSQRPTLTWVASPGALDYLVQIATDAGFSNVVASATVTGTQWASNITLAANSSFFWRVRPSNYCGNGGFSSVRSFTTGTAGVCAAGQNPVVLFEDAVESGVNGWTTSGTGGTQWAQGAALAGTNLSTTVWRVPNNTVTSDRGLISPSIVVPALANDLTLAYDTYHSFETDGATGCWDAGSLEISTDNGANWTYLDDTRMFTDPYEAVITDGDPLAGRGAWCHVSPNTSVRNIVDLTGFAGQTIRLRYRATSDSNTAAAAPNGWSIDNIKVQRCQ
jgi:hypothetical protein